jgi:hypothetical protein
MKNFYLILFLLFPLLAQAQTFRLDTIPVSPDDPRNIHRQQQLQPQQRTVDVNLQPINGSHATESRATEANVQPVATAQQPQRSVRTENLPPFQFDRNRLRLGAHLGLSSSRNFTSFALGPQVGYLFSDFIMVGAGAKYHHIRANRRDYSVRNNLLGMNVFSYMYPTNFFSVFVQPEINQIWRSVRMADGTRLTDSGTVPVFLIGAGVHFNRFMHITLNYDLVRHRHSPYSDRVFLSISGFF